jgi:predicted nucleotide-binding protein
MSKSSAKKISPPEKKRGKISQSDIPAFSLTQALKVADAIFQNFGKDPAKPLRVADAMGLSPQSSYFRVLTGAAVAFGITEGAYNATVMSLTPLGRRIFAPKEEGDDLLAKREAMLKPKIVASFLRKYEDSALPPASIAVNVLEDMGVPRDRAQAVYDMIVEGADAVGFIRVVKDKKYVDLGAPLPAQPTKTEIDLGDLDTEDEQDGNVVAFPDIAKQPEQQQTRSNNRVFITHGKNVDFIEPIKKLLTFGSLEPVVAMEKQTVSQPVPDKVLAAMRSCSAAIIHVDAEQKLIDPDGKEHTVLNPNVLIEIGAAMALYGKRFILLVRDGVQVPSNLQGLYEVRYSGDKLDSDVTIKLLQAISDIKNYQLPN